MIRHACVAAAALLLATVLGTGTGWAGYRVCNRSAQRIDVAFGYPHPQFGWTSEGWWTIQPGRCRTIMRGDLTNRYYYLYATGSAGGIWQAAPGQRGGFFCISMNKFVFHNSNFIVDGELNCGSRNLQSKQFVMVDTEGAPNHVHNLNE